MTSTTGYVPAMKLYRYWGRPDGVVRHYDASTPQAAEESAHQILTLMDFDGYFRQLIKNLVDRGFGWGIDEYDSYSVMTFRQIHEITDPAARDLAMAVYEAEMYYMVGQATMGRVGINTPAIGAVHMRKDEASTVAWNAAVFNASEKRVETFSTGVLYRDVTFQELLEAVGGPWTLEFLETLNVTGSESKFTEPKFGIELVW